MNIEKSLRSSLNKASETNKYVIIRNLIDITKDVNESEHADELVIKFIGQIFDKCICERNFIPLYVDILYELFLSIKPLYPDLASKLYRSLITRSQTEFEEDITFDNRTGKISCILFIAALTEKGFINKKLANQLIEKLLKSDNEFKYEIACVFMSHIPINILDPTHKNQLVSLSTKEGISQRIRFMIQDMVEKISKIN